MKRLQKSATQKPLTDIGLSENLIAPNRLHLIGNKTPIPAKLDESTLGQRVSEEERVEILHHFKRICEENNITLVVIHPSYQHSSPHECVLTAFCKNNNVPMFEAYSSLHPPELPPGSLFLDVWHPGVEGHRRLGRDLAHFLTPLIFRK